MRSVRTTFRILEAVGDAQPIGLSELSRQLELPKSTVQRSLATLADLGWIRSDGRDRTRWMLGDRARELGEAIDDLGRLRDAAMPALGQLNEETLETIHLAVPDAGAMRLVERQNSKHALRLVKPIGTRSPLHAGSTGKSVLAHLPAAEVDDYISGGLSPATRHTIVEAQALREELVAVRERGYAVADQEFNVGVVSVAAAIRPNGGRPVAAISITGPASRMKPDLLATYGRLVSAAAGAVAADLRR